MKKLWNIIVAIGAIFVAGFALTKKSGNKKQFKKDINENDKKLKELKTKTNQVKKKKAQIKEKIVEQDKKIKTVKSKTKSTNSAKKTIYDFEKKYRRKK